MKERFILWLLEALNDDRVRDAIAEIVEEAKPKPVHRPISKNSAPGAI